MALRVIKVDARVIIGAPGDFYAFLFEPGLDLFVGGRLHAQRHMVELGASAHRDALTFASNSAIWFSPPKGSIAIRPHELRSYRGALYRTFSSWADRSPRGRRDRCRWFFICSRDL